MYRIYFIIYYTNHKQQPYEKKNYIFCKSNKNFVQNSLLILSEYKALAVYLMNSAIKAQSYSLNWSYLT
jgi:hypothetical protein